MTKVRTTQIAWGAAVALAYVALGTLAFVIGPASSSKNDHSCTLSGTGSGRTTQGDSSTFRIFVFSSPPGGAVLFTDQGPTSPLQLQDRSISVVACSSRGEAATVAGRFAPGSRSTDSIGFRIHLGAAPGTDGRLTFQIHLTNGYDSGTETLTRADLDIEGHTLKARGVASS
jgi:hypothetical protein